MELKREIQLNWFLCKCVFCVFIGSFYYTVRYCDIIINLLLLVHYSANLVLLSAHKDSR